MSHCLALTILKISRNFFHFKSKHDVFLNLTRPDADLSQNKINKEAKERKLQHKKHAKFQHLRGLQKHLFWQLGYIKTLT